ncbi:hypothetical protein NDA14_006371 [Ustilago hordei]|uniref:Probable wd-repeat protein 5 n=1 Tax=Ustilago hordei TaxID=120017 RepID=I2FQJ7_USTHO|nr:putative wd-repeat protein 5 [Ustilago hordei]KAJ1042874.1 hypothetical protein NDA10_007856 [Ustilago hordei]KAJ1571160.1 hypothetical protein NDA12_001115 [Ustilago hordei]KAJ1571604.1 hypothetical protein NDA15_007658 [Ustilago hordei]KAJ1596761.1 hypothetical protein NDA14_006371 [Ustilago hordei]UTT90039.1 hypothetical protein NDA17_002938 [Ustilago hordei]
MSHTYYPLHQGGENNASNMTMDMTDASCPIAAPQLMYTLTSHLGSPSSLSFSPSGQLLATASSDSTLTLWSLSTGSHLHTFSPRPTQISGCGSGINAISWSSDSTYIATASDDHTIKVFSIVTHRLVRTFSEHTSFVLCLAFNAQSTLLVSGSFDETVRLWNVGRNKCHRTIAAHSEAVSGVHFNRDGTMIVSCSYDGLIRLWDTTTGQCLKTLVHKDQSAIGGVEFTPSGGQLLSSSLDSTVRMWDIFNSKIVKTYTGHTNLKLPLTAQLAFHPGSKQNSQRIATVLSASEEGKVLMWHTQSKEKVVEWQAHKESVIAVTVHPTRNILATASTELENAVRVWFFPAPTQGIIES